MVVLDPRLQSLLATRAHHAALIRRGELAAGDAPPTPDRVGVLVKLTGDIADLHAAGLHTGSVIGDPNTPFRIVTGSIALDDVQALAAVPHVRKVEMGRPLEPELDVSTVEIRAKPLHTGSSPLTGSGVIVGIIDSGFDYRHHAFRFASGGSRVLSIWDQSLTVRARRPGDPFQETAPPEFPTLGVEYTQAQINQALQSSKAFDIVRVADDELAHGTHVAGIAAGDGSQAGTKSGESCTGADTYVGVAPRADIIFVRYQSTTFALGRSQELVDAINYIFTRAKQQNSGAGKPCVINISMGDNLGPHDGTSLVEQAIDMMLAVAWGRAIVKSAGNEGDAKHHALAGVPLPGSRTITFDMPANVTNRQYMECWYDGTQRLDVRLFAPGTPAPVSPVVRTGDPALPWVVNQTAPTEQQVTVTITNALNDPENNDNSILLEFVPPASGSLPNGEWRIEFTNAGAAAVDIHCWLERGSRRKAPVFTSDVTSSHTISVPGTSAWVITVGAYSAEALKSGSGETTQKGDLDIDSSRGPTRRGAIKPDISAPGVSVTAARADSHGGCCCDCCYTFYVDKSGTSMAAPHVTGVIALMLQKNPMLDTAGIRSALVTTARAPDPITAPTLPNNDWGAGKVDATAAVGSVPAPGAGAGGGGGGGGGGPVPFWEPPSMPGGQPMMTRRLRDVHDLVLSFPAGHAWAALVSRHVDEVLRLIETNRRVATVWHRNGGPALVRAVMSIGEQPSAMTIPFTLDGEPLAPRLGRILTNWRRYGSPALVSDIDRYHAAVLSLPGRSLVEILGGREETAA